MIRDVTEQELHALRLFARTYGRTWKAKLAETYWYNARVFTYGTESYNCLHALRNDPRWAHRGLAAFRFPKDDSTSGAPNRHGYNPVSVNQAIEASNRAGRRICGREARAIHALLAGR